VSTPLPFTVQSPRLPHAKLNELNPEGYLGYVLERMADHAINRIEALFLWNVTARLPSLRLAA
jgi:hypothetical protein